LAGLRSVDDELQSVVPGTESLLPTNEGSVTARNGVLSEGSTIRCNGSPASSATTATKAPQSWRASRTASYVASTLSGTRAWLIARSGSLRPWAREMQVTRDPAGTPP